MEEFPQHIPPLQEKRSMCVQEKSDKFGVSWDLNFLQALKIRNSAFGSNP